MQYVTIVPLAASVPDWLALTGVAASIGLALLTLSLMLVRLRPAPDEDTSTAPAAVRDPVLLISTACVILLAVAAWLLR